MGIKLFEELNQQPLLEELTKADKTIIEKYGMGYDKFCSILTESGLDPKNVYLMQNQIFNVLLYVGEYAATDIIVCEDAVLGGIFHISHAKDRDEAFKKLFLEKKYDMVFHSEFNRLALHYFLKHYKKIDKEYLYDTFIECFQSISYGFGKIPKEVYEEVFSNPPSRQSVIERLKEDLNGVVTDKTKLTIFRSQGTKSTPIEDAYSWTLSLEFARKFQSFNEGKIYKGNVLVKNIIDYLGGGEKEVLVAYKHIYNIVREG